MKKALLTKLFYFSASFSRGRRVYGHNYTLSVTVRFSEKLDETLMEKKIQKGLIHKIHSRDLGLDVPFLKKIPLTDYYLLKAFFKIISREIHPVRLHGLCLERDSKTRLSL